jgi:hypothetical protein
MWNETAFKGFNYREEGYAAIDTQRLKQGQTENMANTSDEFKKFDQMMRQLMHTSHDEVKAKLDAEKGAQAKKRKPKKSSASRAAGASSRDSSS